MHAHTLMPTSKGGYDFGRIPEVRDGIADGALCVSGAIRLQYGNAAYGYVHATDHEHRRKIAHYYQDMEPLTFLEIVCQSYSRIYLQQDRSLFLLKFNGVTKSVVIARFVTSSEHYYRIITAYPLERLPNFSKRGARLIWER